MITTLFILLILVSIFLVMIILVQLRRGGGLSGALRLRRRIILPPSALFKTGDVFTTLTVVTFVVFVVLAIILSFQFKFISPPTAPRDVATSEITTNGFTVSWTDSADNETAYKIEQYNAGANRPSNDTKWTTIVELPSSPDTGTVIKKTITGQHLDLGTTYKFHVPRKKWRAGSTDKIFDVLVPGNKPATTKGHTQKPQPPSTPPRQRPPPNRPPPCRRDHTCNIAHIHVTSARQQQPPAP